MQTQSGRVTISRYQIIGGQNQEQEYTGSRTPEHRQDGTLTGRLKKRMTKTRARPVDIRPGTRAAANQRAACLSPVRVYPGWSQSGAVSFSATRCTHV